MAEILNKHEKKSNDNDDKVQVEEKVDKKIVTEKLQMENQELVNGAEEKNKNEVIGDNRLVLKNFQLFDYI